VQARLKPPGVSPGLWPLVGLENLLAEAEDSRRHFEQLVLAEELSACSRLNVRGGTSCTVSSEPEARMLVSFFSLTMFTSRSFGPRVLADNHPLVDFLARRDEERPARLEILDRVRGRLGGAVGHEGAVRPLRDGALPGLVPSKM